VSHVWPGITPLNVWQLQVREWLMYAQGADDWTAAKQKESRG
jgi:hypothetical protein